MPKPIVVVGSLNMDLVLRVSRAPSPGETVLAEDSQAFPGGKGANQAVAAARLGATVRMIGRVGTDGFGDVLLHSLATEHVDTSHVLRDPSAPTGIALITVDAKGQNSIVVAPGANAHVTPQDVVAAESAFEDASLLLLQFECPEPPLVQAMELARRYRLKIVVNPAPARSLDGLPIEDIDFLIPNETELTALAGAQPGSSLPETARTLREIGVRNLVVTLGDRGAWVLEDGAESQLPAHHVQVVDTTAAGDAFVGAFAVALVEGHSTLEAASWGNAAGALAATKAGAQPSLPRREELLKLLPASA